MTAPATLRSAASVLVLRDGSSGLEVLVLRRAAETPSAPGAIVFPGGTTDPADRDREALKNRGIDDDTLSDQWGFDEAGMAVAVALRELFEESGVLVTLESTTSQLRQELRELLLDTPANFYEILSSHGLHLDPSGLSYVAHWRTPVGRPRRFDTRFFALRAPVDQEATCDGHEAVEDIWTTPQEALARFHRGEWSMLLPTRTILAELATYVSVNAAFDAWHGRAVSMVQPVDIEVNGVTMAVVPEATA
jgi:8-oxo-dGTP pyrophosphatase MutT (NUDIX family)